MIIRLEANGEPCLDDDGSEFDEKCSLDIPLPEQSYQPDQPIHPVLRNINTGYASSISTVSDSQSITTTTSGTFHPPSLSTRRRPPLFSHAFTRHHHDGPISSGTTVGESAESRKAKRAKISPLSWSELSKSRKWLLTWIVLTLAMCIVVALVVWAAVRRSIRRVLFQNVNSEWSLEDMNIYNQPVEMFGCPNQSSVSANSSHVLLFIPYGKQAAHNFAIQGGASGQVTLTSSPDPKAQEIAYDLFLQGPNAALNGVFFNTPPTGPATKPVTDFIMNTPTPPIFIPPPGSKQPTIACLRYDVTMYIPRTLKTLSLNISSPTQITFSPQGHIELDSLTIALSSRHPRTKIEATETLHATKMTLGISSGLVHGSISIGDSTTISTFDGQIILNAIPNSATDLSNPSTATLTTTTQGGSVSLTYLRNSAYRKRKIQSHHYFKLGIGRFDYSSSSFDGLLYSNSTRYNVTNVDYERLTPTNVNEGEWTRAWGNKTGDDRIYITSGMGRVLLP